MPDDKAEPISPDQRRQVARLTTEYFLTQTRLLTAVVDADLVSALLFLAITHANVSHVTADPELDARFGRLEDIPPNEVRRSVSVYALAKSLSLPYETARRHAKKLLDAGLCERDPDGGLFVPASVFARPDFMSTTNQHWQETNRFVRAMMRAGVTFEP
jgi:DNA-binding transcriptional ArsR family regulator